MTSSPSVPSHFSPATPVEKAEVVASPSQLGNLLGLFLLFMLITGMHSMRGFWYDELFSFHMSQQPGIAGVWRALMAGADVNPPLGYVIVRAFQAVLGNGEFATRLPEMLGFFLMSLCLYRFVARNSSPRFAYLAAILPMCSGAYVLASEARPYGLMLGFAGLALVCWQEAAARTRRAWFLFAFALSLSASLMSHCYAVLILIPFGLAEIVRQVQGGRFDAKMWAALIAPTACIAVYFPLMANMKPYITGNYFFKVPWTSLPQAYAYLLTPALWPLVISALLLTFPFFAPKSEPDTKGLRLHEWAVAAGFAILPGVGVLLAKIMSSQFFPRYGSTGIIGLSLLLALYLSWRNTPLRTMSLVNATFVISFVLTFGQWLYPLVIEPPIAEKASLSSMERRQTPYVIRPELPFVSASAIKFFELDHYGTPELASRLYYLLDRDAALEYTQTDIFEGGFPLMKRWFPMRGQLAQYKEFVRDHPKFLVFGHYNFANDWLLKKLIDDGATMSLITDSESTLGDLMLFEVTTKQSARQ